MVFTMAPFTVRPDVTMIFALIKEQGHTVTSFAAAHGFVRQWLYNIQSGNRPRMSIDRAERLARALGVDADVITLAGEAGQEAA